MLQQTTVAAVTPYYNRFLERFPTVRDLAEAPQAEVLRFWEGLGYYSRARNLQRAAQIVCEDFDGHLPDSSHALQSLPGIGRYTAGAIASFAFGSPAPIVEANTLRLYCRLIGFDGDPRSVAGQRTLWDFAGQLVPAQRPGEFNQALMDLGATICTPLAPACDQCPLRFSCLACASGRQEEIPRPPRRAPTTNQTDVLVLVSQRGRYLVRQYPESERWAGLWDFPRFTVDSEQWASLAVDQLLPGELSREIAAKLTVMTGLHVTGGTIVRTLSHSVTRYRIRVLCSRMDHAGGRLHRNARLRWLSPDEFPEHPFSITGRKVARWVESSSAGQAPA